MDISSMLKILMVMVAAIYLSALLIVLIYEWRKISIYKKAKIQMVSVENLQISMAVLHTKVFKVRQDYLRATAEIDRKQQFIFEKVLLIRRSTLKTKYPSVCPAGLL